VTLRPVPLFNSPKEVLGFLAIAMVFLALHVSWIYLKYKDFTLENRHVIQGIVTKHEERISKHNKPYQLLHVKTPRFLLYTVSWDEALHVRVGQYINLTLISENLSFKDYLSKRFFAPSFGHHPLRKSQEGLREKLYSSIASKHENPKMQNLFGALFLGLPVQKELRQDITHWGVAHLIAISGFHLGVLMFFGYWILNPIYSYFQGRYFPYRNRHVDIGVTLLALAYGYMWLIGFVPSFLRSWVMGVVGFWLLYRHIELLSFKTLGVCVVFLVVLFPNLLLHIGFFFSVLGVFYIFLYLHHFKDLFNSKLLHAIFLNIWVFLGMVIPVHFWFGLNTLQQFSAIPLSLSFVLFYPLMSLLHAIGFGGVIDGVLEEFLSMRFGIEGQFITPLWLMLSYLILTVMGIWNRFLAIGVITLGLVPFVFIQITT
jgi:competence protein ComEC